MMLIDSYTPDFESVLRQQYQALPSQARMFLLIDGAFVPGLFREILNRQPVLLFRTLPGFSEKVKDVSPFLVEYQPTDDALSRMLHRCSGWPMVSALTTVDTVDELADRLAAWCIVEAGGQRFNFRFPDTRRLPSIYETLSDMQAAEMAGNVIDWRYIGRDGTWYCLKIRYFNGVFMQSLKKELNEAQFSRLAGDSEADELWVRLQYRGATSSLKPSQRHLILSNALHIANNSKIDELAKIRWCAACLNLDPAGIDQLPDQFAKWSLQNLGENHGKLPQVT